MFLLGAKALWRYTKMPKDTTQIGGYAFLLGAIIAILAGLAAGAGVQMATYGAWITLVLVILGLIVGFLNIGDKETTPFLIAAIALIVLGSARLGSIDVAIAPIGSVLQSMVTMIAVFVAPAALIVSLKAVWNFASGKVA